MMPGSKYNDAASFASSWSTARSIGTSVSSRRPTQPPNMTPREERLWLRTFYPERYKHERVQRRAAAAAATGIPPTRASVSTVAERKQKSVVPVKYLASLINRKIVERTRCPQDQYREAYKMFGNPVDGITMHEFRRHMIRMGVPIAESDLTRLFDYLDDDNNGAIDFQEMVNKVIPKDYGFDCWAEEKAYKSDAEYIQKAMKLPPAELTRDDTDEELSIDHLNNMLYQKIVERTRIAQDQQREAFMMFGAPAAGIPFDAFKDRILNLGMVLPDRDIARLFSYFDHDGNGVIDFHEMVHTIMPKDYGYDCWGAEKTLKNGFQYIKHAMRVGHEVPSVPERLKAKVEARREGKPTPRMVSDAIEAERTGVLVKEDVGTSGGAGAGAGATAGPETHSGGASGGQQYTSVEQGGDWVYSGGANTARSGAGSVYSTGGLSALPPRPRKHSGGPLTSQQRAAAIAADSFARAAAARSVMRQQSRAHRQRERHGARTSSAAMAAMGAALSSERGGATVEGVTRVLASHASAKRHSGGLPPVASKPTGAMTLASKGWEVPSGPSAMAHTMPAKQGGGGGGGYFQRYTPRRQSGRRTARRSGGGGGTSRRSATPRSARRSARGALRRPQTAAGGLNSARRVLSHSATTPSLGL